MHDGQNMITDRRADHVSGGFADLAVKVVARLVAREGQVAPAFREPIVQRLVDAVQSADPSLFEALKPDLRRARITPEILADIYIPEAARRLGQGWEDDCLSFASVTIGTARLQLILRELSADWASDAVNNVRHAGAVLVLLPEDEHHTLGALVLTGQLRRRGVSVCLQLATADGGWRQVLRQRQFDGVMVSVGWEGKIGVGTQMVRRIKDLTDGKMPVAVGGAVLTRSDDILACEGADVVTNDIDKALYTFGLSASSNRAVESA